MKLLTSLSVLAAALALSSPVFAQVSATQVVSVNATVASACVFDSAGPLALSTNYPAFSAAVVDATGSVTVQCTRGGSSTPSINFTSGGAIGTVGGLVFQLSAAYTGGSGGTAPAGTSITDLGSAQLGTFAVKASFPAGQAGSDGTNTAVTRTMTLTF